MATKRKKEEARGDIEWPFGPKNYMLFGVALAVIILGYFVLSTGDITWSPILLVLGYCVLIPLAIMLRGRPEEPAEDFPSSDE